MKILVVDDSAVMRKIIVRELLKAGCSDIIQTGSGQEALSEIGAKEPDGVFVDWNLAPMSSLEFLSELRETSNIPVVVVITETQENEVAQALKAGANDYIVKPFDQPTLIYKLKYLVNK